MGQGGVLESLSLLSLQISRYSPQPIFSIAQLEVQFARKVVDGCHDRTAPCWRDGRIRRSQIQA
jgi:hypothetical protein